MADVEFQSVSGRWIDCHSYIDSGADITLIPFSFGKLLRLEIEKEKIRELYGLGKQRVAVIYQRVKMKISRYIFDVLVAWALIEDVPTLLGRSDIFDCFHITFQQNRKIIEFAWQEAKSPFGRSPKGWHSRPLR